LGQIRKAACENLRKMMTIRRAVLTGDMRPDPDEVDGGRDAAASASVADAANLVTVNVLTETVVDDDKDVGLDVAVLTSVALLVDNIAVLVDIAVLSTVAGLVNVVNDKVADKVVEEVVEEVVEVLLS
jgi:hypothetical protein